MALIVDTLGQDRVLTDAERSEARKWARCMEDAWERSEEMLLQDSTI